MRALLIGSLVAAALVAAPASANVFIKPLGKIVLFDASDGRSSDLPTIARGTQFGVNCGCMGSGADDIRVVLAVSQEPGQKPTGYQKFLVTEERVDHGALRVTVPDAPDLANHTVDVRIYVVGTRGTRACDAGRVKIT
jgi:hypothetical protein